MVHPAVIPAVRWQRDAAERFSRRLLAGNPAFPCVFGVDALRKGSLRFTFVPAGAHRVRYLAAVLEEFAKVAEHLGKRTSLVAFFEPDHGLETLGGNEAYAWWLLRALHAADPAPWPDVVPADTEHPEWEFCFAGTPMFVVVNTPAHRRRMSRFFEYFCMTFQPRFVFDDIGEGTPQGDNARKIIRKRLHAYDSVPPAPVLGGYGTPGNREWTQYFLGDDNCAVAESERCPFEVSSACKEEA